MAAQTIHFKDFYMVDQVSHDWVCSFCDEDVSAEDIKQSYRKTWSVSKDLLPRVFKDSDGISAHFICVQSYGKLNLLYGGNLDKKVGEIKDPRSSGFLLQRTLNRISRLDAVKQIFRGDDEVKVKLRDLSNSVFSTCQGREFFADGSFHTKEELRDYLLN